ARWRRAARSVPPIDQQPGRREGRARRYPPCPRGACAAAPRAPPLAGPRRSAPDATVARRTATARPTRCRRPLSRSWPARRPWRTSPAAAWQRSRTPGWRPASAPTPGAGALAQLGEEPLDRAALARLVGEGLAHDATGQID